MNLEIKKLTTVLKTYPFDVEQIDLYDHSLGRMMTHPFHRLQCPDWVNIFPLTTASEVVLVEQDRSGSMQATLETPGGVVESAEPDPMAAAIRELEEETGYAAGNVTSLGHINPNPAIMTNRLHIYLATDCFPKEDRRLYPDENESIRVKLVPLEDLKRMLNKNELDSALAALVAYKAITYLNEGAS